MQEHLGLPPGMLGRQPGVQPGSHTNDVPGQQDGTPLLLTPATHKPGLQPLELLEEAPELLLEELPELDVQAPSVNDLIPF